MPAPVYIGDEVSAAGYRLAGALVRVPAPGEEAAALAHARAEAPLVLIAAAVAARLAADELSAALTAPTPLALVVPDLSGTNVPDLSARLRRQLGLES
jgi:vacuolar-type H+-ATPase subunit F/Vma7